MNKLGFTEKQVRYMTIGKFNRLYKAYKDNFDLEMTMKLKGITYASLKKSEVKQRNDYINF